jgi:hypothetical protein
MKGLSVARRSAGSCLSGLTEETMAAKKKPAAKPAKKAAKKGKKK